MKASRLPSQEASASQDSDHPVESVSVVVPVFNEAPAIESVVEDLLTIVDAVPGSELVLVDDGSTDETGEILQALASADDRVRVVRAPSNRGHGASLLAGIDVATRPRLFLMDADGQIEAREFKALWELREADLVIGRRQGRTERRHRRALSYFVEKVASGLAGKRIPDPNVPFKLVSRALWDDLRPFIPEQAKTPSLLIALGAALRGRRIESVPVVNHPRATGRSKLNLGRLASLSVAAFVQLLAFRMRVRRVPTTDHPRRSRDSATTAGR